MFSSLVSFRQLPRDPLHLKQIDDTCEVEKRSILLHRFKFIGLKKCHIVNIVLEYMDLLKLHINKLLSKLVHHKVFSLSNHCIFSFNCYFSTNRVFPISDFFVEQEFITYFVFLKLECRRCSFDIISERFIILQVTEIRIGR